MDVRDDVAAARVPGHAAIAADAAAAHRIGAGTMEAKAESIGSEEIAIGRVTAIHRHPIRVIGHNDHRRYAVLGNRGDRRRRNDNEDEGG
jgi:hypothetical protein